MNQRPGMSELKLRTCVTWKFENSMNVGLSSFEFEVNGGPLVALLNSIDSG